MELVEEVILFINDQHYSFQARSKGFNFYVLCNKACKPVFILCLRQAQADGFLSC